MNTLTQNPNLDTGNPEAKDKLRLALETAVERGDVLGAVQLQGNLMGLRGFNTADNPLPEGTHAKVVGDPDNPIELNGSGIFDRRTIPSEVTAMWDPQDFRFMRDAAQEAAASNSDLRIAQEQARTAVDFTGKFIVNLDGYFTAYTGDGHCVFGRGDPTAVTEYLKRGRFIETTPDKIPDIAQWLHNQPTVARR